MALALTTPGVYIQELPSGARSIAGVSTSLTAFVGATSRGPVDTPTLVDGFAAFERAFGGLSPTSTMTHAVRHYFLNGGSEALIVRVVNRDDEAEAASVRVTAPGGLGTFTLAAATPGADGNALRVLIDLAGAPPGTFNLVLRRVDAGGSVLVEETHNGVTLAAGPTELGSVLTTSSTLAVRVTDDAAATAVDASTARPFSGGADAGQPTVASVRVTAPGGLGTFTLAAASRGTRLAEPSPGAWGNALRVRTSTQDAAAGTFHLVLREVDAEGNTVAEETHHGVTLVAGPRSLGDVLAGSSTLAVRVADSAVAPVDASATFRSFAGGDDGEPPGIADTLGDEGARTGIHALRNADGFNLLCIPLTGGWASSDAEAVALWDAASLLCEQRRAFVVVDPPSDWSTAAAAIAGSATLPIRRSNNAAMYFPEVLAPDPLQEGRLRAFPPSGAVAGVIARSDAQRGVWKSPAGIESNLVAVPDLRTKTSDAEQGRLNGLGINVLRRFAVYGTVVWGARTLRGADALASEWKYLGVRRLALHLHESLHRGSQWAVFEPNDHPLWGQLRTSIGAFMHTLFRQGAFAGKSAREAYLVKCDAETTTPADIERGIVNVIIGFAPLRPAEFVFIKLQQIVAQVA